MRYTETARVCACSELRTQRRPPSVFLKVLGCFGDFKKWQHHPVWNCSSFCLLSVSEIHYLRRIPRLRQRRLRQKRLRQKKAATKGVPCVQLRFQWAFSKQKACVRSLSPPCRTRAVPYMWVARGRLEMLATRALRVAE